MSEDTTRRAALGAFGTAVIGSLAGCGSAAETGTATPTDTGAAAAAVTAASETTATTTEPPSGTRRRRPRATPTASTRGCTARRPTPSGSQGSAFLYDDTRLVTNYRVVGSADRMSARFDDGASRIGRVVGRDPRSDLAAIEISTAEGRDPLSLVDSQPVIGTHVAVVGGPYGLQGSLTSAIVADGEYDHPHLGVDTIQVTDLVARANDLPDERGVLVRALADDAPAAGELRPATGFARVQGFRVPVGGDAILTIDGERIGTPRDLHAYLALNATPGETLPVRVRRDGEVTTVRVEVGAQPDLRPSAGA